MTDDTTRQTNAPTMPPSEVVPAAAGRPTKPPTWVVIVTLVLVLAALAADGLATLVMFAFSAICTDPTYGGCAEAFGMSSLPLLGALVGAVVYARAFVKAKDAGALVIATGIALLLAAAPWVVLSTW